jgi:hypothetical protein
MKNIKTYELFGLSSTDKLLQELRELYLGTNNLLKAIFNNNYSEFKKCLNDYTS